MFINRLRLFQNLLVLSLVTLITIVWSTVIFLSHQNEQLFKQGKIISSYEECAGSGNVILESYPSICITKDGQRFVQQLQTSVNEPDNWQEYVDSDYNFSVSHPSYITPQFGTNDLVLKSIYFHETGEETRFWMTIEVNQSSLEFSNAVENELAIISHGNGKLLKKADISIQNYNSIRADYDSQSSGGKPISHIYIDKKPYIYAIHTYTKDVDQILSTFRFESDQ